MKINLLPFDVEEKDWKRFWRSVEKSEGCWLWVGSGHPRGYGRFSFQWRYYLSHRFLFQALNGRIKRWDLVCHTCDNRRCVRPDHLFLATSKENTRDCLEKGRFCRGEDHPAKKDSSYLRRGTAHYKAKLDPERVAQARQKYKEGGWSYISLGKEFGVCGSTMGNIIVGRAWKNKKEE